MKQINMLMLTFLFFFSGSVAVAQGNSQTFKVWGNCGMCKKTIEAAALKSGATSASWDQKTKVITLAYNPTATKIESIQKSIAEAGYDNDGFSATDEAYNKLHGCCQYERKSGNATAEVKACCMKDGKCQTDKKCCKKNKSIKECCSKATCGNSDGCCSPDKMKKSGCCSSSKSSSKTCEKKCSDHKH